MADARFDTSNLFGLWQLVSLDAIRPNGKLIKGWLGTKPTGFIAYDRSGSMSVQMMSGPRGSGSQETAAADFEYYAYFGIFEIDEGAQTIMHRVQGSMRADEVGMSYKQNLTLLRGSVDPADGHAFGPRRGKTKPDRLAARRQRLSQWCHDAEVAL